MEYEEREKPMIHGPGRNAACRAAWENQPAWLGAHRLLDLYSHTWLLGRRRCLSSGPSYIIYSLSLAVILKVLFARE
jgi:hypothetical protein